MTILPTLALRSFVGFDNLFNELETVSTQKQNSFPAYDLIRISADEYEITLALSGFNKKDISIDIHDGVLTIKGNGGNDTHEKNTQYLYKLAVCMQILLVVSSWFLVGVRRAVVMYSTRLVTATPELTSRC